MRWVSVFTGAWEFNLRCERDHANFFLFFFPFDVLFIYLFIFFHQDAYKCFPFIIFLNIDAPIIIIRTLFLCSFHNNDSKCFVGYF